MSHAEAFGPPAGWDEGAPRRGGLALPRTGPTAQEVRVMPAGPASLSLFLAAVAAFGGWRLVQAGRGLHVCATPVWFHTGAPARIGRAELIRLSGTDIAPVCATWPLHEPPVGSPAFSLVTPAIGREAAPDAWHFLTEMHGHAPPPVAA